MSFETIAQRPSFDQLRRTGGSGTGQGNGSGFGGGRSGGMSGLGGQNAGAGQGGGSTPKPSTRKPKMDRGTVVSVIPDSLRSKDNAGFEDFLEYAADDSTIMDAENEVLYLFGNATVIYGDISLDANYIRIDWGKNEIIANGSKDTTGKHDAIGKPVFTERETAYNMDSIRYNFQTKKALIKGIVTQQGDGYLQGAKVKKDSSDNMFFADAKYTTCNLKDPHFHIGAKKIKLINRKQVISGPFRLYLADIPLPLVIPFGWFPIPKNKEIGTSGFIMPTYGEEPNGRGFYLRDGGYFFAISERFNFKVLGQLYSRGSWGLGAQSSYAKKYKYTGNISMQFNNNRPGDSPFSGTSVARDMNIQWSHSPANLRPDRSFSTNVNFVTNGFNRNNAREVEAYTQNNFGSSVQYSRTINQNLRSSISYRIDQNVSTRVANTGFDFSLNANQFNPFVKEKNFTGRKFEQFRVGFDFSGGLTATNNITGSRFLTTDLGYKVKGAVRINPDSLRAAERRFDQQGKYSDVLPLKSIDDLKAIINNGQFRGTFSVPIALPNFKLAKYINFTPSMSMSGNVYTRQYKYAYDAQDTSVDIDTTRGAFFVPNFNFGAGMNTRAYGTFYVRKGRLEAIRHTFAPTISMGFTPNLAENPYYFQNTQVDPERRLFLPRFDNLSTPGRFGSISFGIVNQIEAKVKSNADSSETDFEKIPILDNLSFNGGYNMLADSMRLSDISFNANTTLFKKFVINTSATLNPYQYIADKYNANNYTGIKVDRLRNFPQLSSGFISIGTNFKPKGKEKPKQVNKNVPKDQIDFINKNPELYVDFDIPWTVRVDYSFQYSKFGLSPVQASQTLNVNGDLSLTPKWKFAYTSGWDFTYKELTLTTFTLARELHCWDMNFSWTPKAAVGSLRAGNYDFTIRARGSIMQELKLSRRRSFYDRGGF